MSALGVWKSSPRDKWQRPATCYSARPFHHDGRRGRVPSACLVARCGSKPRGCTALLKILDMSQYFLLEMRGPPRQRAYDMFREWVRLGHEVTVLTTLPNHPDRRHPPKYRGNWSLTEIVRRHPGRSCPDLRRRQQGRRLSGPSATSCTAQARASLARFLPVARTSSSPPPPSPLRPWPGGGWRS